MRRKEREVTDFNDIIHIIDKCMVCHLGFIDNGQAYIVPMSFGYECNDKNIVLYFHSASKGKKLDLIKNEGRVSYEMETGVNILKSDLACNYSMQYQSVIGAGWAYIIGELEEKERALQLIMKHNAEDKHWSFSQEVISNMTIIKLVTDQISCKQNI